MFDVGFFELLVIAVLGLLVLGPERLPQAARTAGLWVGRIRRTFNNIQQEVSSQLHAEEMRQQLRENQQKLRDTLDKTNQSLEDIEQQPAAPQESNRDVDEQARPATDKPAAGHSSAAATTEAQDQVNNRPS